MHTIQAKLYPQMYDIGHLHSKSMLNPRSKNTSEGVTHKGCHPINHVTSYLFNPIKYYTRFLPDLNKVLGK